MSDEGIRIGDLLLTIARRWKTLVVLTLLGCGLGLVLNSISFVQGSYTSYAVTTSIAIVPRVSTGGFAGGSDHLTSDDFQLAEDMADSVSYVIYSDRVLEQAIEQARLISVEPEEVARNLGISRYNETQILELTLWWMNAESGVELMNAILDVAVEVLPETLMIGSVAVINPPAAEFTPASNSYTGIWILTSLVGFVIGLGLIIFEFTMHPTLLNPKSVEEDLGLEMLGIVPQDHAYFQRKGELLSRESAVDSTVEQSFASAAYILCNRLGSSKKKSHCVYVTSAEEREGKSTVAANLAIQMSDLEKKVLLIDLNLNNPSLGGMFLQNVDYSRTLNALYKGEATVQDTVVSLTGYLDLLPTVLERNAINLDSVLFDFIQQLSQNYDYIIIDGPAIEQSSDVLRLNQVAQAVLLVIRYDATPLPVIQDTIDQLDKSGIRILGCIVNASRTMHGFRSWRDRPSDLAAKSMRDAAEADDLLLVPAAGNGNEGDLSNPAGAPDILDELTKDPLQKETLSDDEAMDALIRMGADNSWTQKPETPPSQPETLEKPVAPAESAPEKTKAPDGPKSPDDKPVVMTSTVPARPMRETPVQAAPKATAPETQPEQDGARKGFFFGRSKNYKPKH